MFINMEMAYYSDMDIDESEPDYETVRVSHVGYVDPYAIEGIVILKSSSGREFHMRAFSGEVARYINNFLDNERDGVPTIYRMFEEVCENNQMVLVKVKIYDTQDVLRANLYFEGRNGDLILRNYRASDALALAIFYEIPVLVLKTLLKTSLEA